MPKRSPATCGTRHPWKKPWPDATPSSTSPPITVSGCAIPQDTYRSNVEGTRALLEAARRNGVRGWSTPPASPPSALRTNGSLADEDSPVSLSDMIGHYKRSKFMAEQVALEAGRSGMHVVTVNPTTPVGEGDVKPTPTGRIVLDFLKRKFPAVRGNRLNLVDVRECARGTCGGAGARPVRRALHPRRRKPLP